MPGKPRPFSRPHIEVAAGPSRAWAWVSPETLIKGDTLPDFGVISEVVIHRDGEADTDPIKSVEVIGHFGAVKSFDPIDIVQAFVVPKPRD